MKKTQVNFAPELEPEQKPEPKPTVLAELESVEPAEKSKAKAATVPQEVTTSKLQQSLLQLSDLIYNYIPKALRPLTRPPLSIFLRSEESFS